MNHLNQMDETEFESGDGRVGQTNSILDRRTAPTFEIKFLVSQERAEQLLAQVRPQLPPDPNCEPGLEDAYRIRSLYLDSEDLRIYKRSGPGLSRKYRIRGYGHGAVLFLEQKVKKAAVVRKRRTAIPPEDIARLNDSSVEWNGVWFAQQIAKRNYRPQCQLNYLRIARVLTTPSGPIRFTVDRELFVNRLNRFEFPYNGTGLELLGDMRIVEMKFQDAMPNLFRELIVAHRLVPTSLSKYRLAMSRLLGDRVSPSGREG